MRKIFVLLLLSCIVLPQLAFAGAWTLPRNNVWTEFSMKSHWTSEGFSQEKNLGDPATAGTGAKTWGWNMNYKLEYGITDRLTLGSGLEYKEATWKEYNRPASWGPYSINNHGVSNIDIYGKFRLLKDPVVASIQVKVGIYPIEGSAVNRAPELSDRAESLEIRGQIGKVFDGGIVPFYLGMESGYRFKNRGRCNDIPFFVEGGFWPYKWLLIKNEVDGYWSHLSTGFDDKEYATWRVGPIFHLLDIYHLIKGRDITEKSYIDSVTKEGNSVNLEVQFGRTFWGRNTNASHEITGKVSAQF